MARHSLRDEMLRGGTARGTRQRRRSPVAMIVVVAVGLLLVGIIAMLAQVRDSDASSGPNIPVTAPGGDADEAEELDPAGAASPAPVSVDESDDSSVAAVLRQEVAALRLVSGRVSDPYDRDFFGQAWYDEDGNGCDTRNDTLRRDLREVVLKENSNGCKVVSGILDDWYSATTVPFQSGGDTSRLVQIDHVVPLSWAWQHGANSWTDEVRREFANDPMNLRDRAMIRGVIDECETSTAFGEFEK
jgi:hypothetical protein